MTDNVPPTPTLPPVPPERDIVPVTIEEEMRSSYLDYAMSVIVARALPDVRDGLKPVHRRILFAMKEGGYDSGKPTRKSARVVGDVMGKYHPHGDAAIYDAMVRMAQWFSMRLPLIDGQGNFGSMDGDPPAAMRYTEVRLGRPANELLDDIDKDTVDFQANYDETAEEPVVLPARYPNLLVNGAGGIAVGMATNIPPHNLGEVIDATVALIHNPAITTDELMEHVPAPDFPTGAIILGQTGASTAYHTGRGSVVVRAKTHIEEIRKDREAIVVSELPYQVNKSRLVESIADLVREKRIDGISDLRDESDRDGVRVVIELRREAMSEVVLNQLFRFTQMRTTFGVNTLALNDGRPEMMALKDILEAFVAFREDIITRRTVFDLGKARERAHILVGLAVAVANIDEVIALIRAAPDPQTARERLMERSWPAEAVAPLITLINDPRQQLGKEKTCRLTEAQARGILELRLHRLTALERDKIGNEVHEIAESIKEFLEILGSRPRKLEILEAELTEIKERFATPRRTELSDAGVEYDIEDLIQPEDMVVTVSHTGYIKRVPLSTYRSQRRGGRGRAGMSTREQDFVWKLFVANTHAPVLFFSSRGMAYKLKVYTLPEGAPNARGKAMVNLLPLSPDETISTVMALPVDEECWGELNVMFATASGNVRRNSLSDFTRVFANGKIAMKLDRDDRLVGVRTCTENEDVLLATRGGKCIRFSVGEVRVFSGRTSTGVRGIRLAKGDEVISMSIVDHAEAESRGERDAYVRQASAARRGEGAPAGVDEEIGLAPERFVELAAAEQFILTVTENGFGKRTSAYEYRITRRGGQGIVNIDTGSRNGNVVASFPVGESDQIMMVTDAGQLIRTTVDGIRIAGRNTQGVTLFRVEADERVTSVSRFAEDGEGEGNGNDGLPRRGNGADAASDDGHRSAADGDDDTAPDGEDEA